MKLIGLEDICSFVASFLFPGKLIYPKTSEKIKMVEMQ